MGTYLTDIGGGSNKSNYYSRLGTVNTAWTDVIQLKGYKKINLFLISMRNGENSGDRTSFTLTITKNDGSANTIIESGSVGWWWKLEWIDKDVEANWETLTITKNGYGWVYGAYSATVY